MDAHNVPYQGVRYEPSFPVKINNSMAYVSPLVAQAFRKVLVLLARDAPKKRGGAVILT